MTDDAIGHIAVRVMRDNLLSAVVDAARAASPRSSLPILSNVLLKASADGLVVTATDLEIAISARAGGIVLTEGEVTVNAKALVAWLKGAPKGELVEFEHIRPADGDGSLVLKCGGNTTTMPVISADEFPIGIIPLFVDGVTDERAVRIMSDSLGEALDATAPLTLKDETRPILTGVLARPDGHRVTFAASDNYRIATVDVEMVDTFNPDESPLGGYVILGRGLAILAKMLPRRKAPEAVSVLFPETQKPVTFSWSSRAVLIRIIDGIFPNYQQVIPVRPDCDQTAAVERDALIAALKPAVDVAKNGNNTILIAARDNRITLSSNDGNGQTYEGAVAAETKGDWLWAGNGGYLLDLATSPSEILDLAFLGALSPLLVRGTEGAWTQVIMPVRSPMTDR
jgi:DNA polymerase-3 subunit beta